MIERASVEFPDGFLWGAATASYQIEGAVQEGGRGPSVWDVFSHTPGKIANGDTGDVACDHYHRLDQDLDLMVDLGLRAYRFSISWSRVLPEGKGRLNPHGVDFYNRLIDGLLARDIVPNATLFHWDLPSTLEANGGFRNRDTAKWFSDYAAQMADVFSDRVKMWATLNEPWCFAYLGHAAGIHAPGLIDDHAAVTVAHHELLAHGLAVEAMRAERSDLELGIVLNVSPVSSLGSPAASSDAIRRIDGIQNRWWLDAILNGRYPSDVLDDFGPLADAIQDGDLAQIAQPIDWLGVNFYFELFMRGLRVEEKPVRAYPTVTDVTDSDRAPIHTDMGWPITPESFTAILTRIAADYPNVPPIYITENGCAFDDPIIGGQCDDQRRIEYLDLHLRALADAISDGVDVRGYFQWSLLDNFEWALGFDKRFGLVHVDFDTLRRTPRASAYWYRDVMEHNRLRPR